MSKQPRDDGNAAIPVLGSAPTKGHQVPFTGASVPHHNFLTQSVLLYSYSRRIYRTGLNCNSL